MKGTQIQTFEILTEPERKYKCREAGSKLKTIVCIRINKFHEMHCNQDFRNLLIDFTGP